MIDCLPPILVYLIFSAGWGIQNLLSAHLVYTTEQLPIDPFPISTLALFVFGLVYASAPVSASFGLLTIPWAYVLL